MLRNIRNVLAVYLFWVVFFVLERLLFVLYNLSRYEGITGEIPQAFLYGLRMDASMAAYICALPLLLYILRLFIPGFKVPLKATLAYFYIILFLCSFFTVLNINIYREWGTKLPYRVIATFFENPKEAIVSSESAPILLSFSLIFGLFLLGMFGIRFLLRQPFFSARGPLGVRVFWALSSIFVLFFFIRSGFQTTPLNPSMAYFSSRPLLNHTAVNTEWNLMDDMLHSGTSGVNPYAYMEDLEALERISPYINRFLEQPEETYLSTSRPNVVLIILESFTAELIERLGGEPGIAPNFERLIDEGMFFSQVYATGDRTDKGMIAVMSGFPSQATQSIIKNVNKLEKLPSLGQSFKDAGYATSFFYGGESEFYNIKSYMLSHGMDRVIDRHSFPAEQTDSKWGAFDHLTFQKQLDSLDAERQPFFSVMLSLSNHEPFEVPGTHHFGTESNASLFKSTAFYTDSALWDYFKKAKQEPWYEQTLFVVVADHGHRLPSGNKASYEPRRYHIPMLLFGAPIKPEYRGLRIDKIGNQTDLPSTLLALLDLDSRPFFWSRNLLNPKTLPFAFYDWDNGMGVVLPEQSLSFDNVGKRTIEKSNPESSEAEDETTLKLAQAYLQIIYQQYLDF